MDDPESAALTYQDTLPETIAPVLADLCSTMRYYYCAASVSEALGAPGAPLKLDPERRRRVLAAHTAIGGRFAMWLAALGAYGHRQRDVDAYLFRRIVRDPRAPTTDVDTRFMDLAWQALGSVD